MKNMVYPKSIKKYWTKVVGRKRKYHTEKERRNAQRKWQMEHYLRNKEKIKQKARDKYRERKRKELYEKKASSLYNELDI